MHLELEGTLKRGTVPAYLQPLFDAAKGICQEPQEARLLSELLTRYSIALISADCDMGRTTLVEHCSRLAEIILPVCQPPLCLGLEKEAKLKRQVAVCGAPPLF